MFESVQHSCRQWSLYGVSIAAGDSISVTSYQVTYGHPTLVLLCSHSDR